MEIFHSMHVGRPFLKYNFMAFKLDMMKAYDHIEWGYLRSMLRKFPFSERWISMIMECFCLVFFLDFDFSIFFTIAGDPTG